jgi:hypothetical protein
LGGINNNFLYAVEKTETKSGYSYSIINPPSISYPYPEDNSTEIDLQPVCNITVSDSDSNTVDVYFYENTTGWNLRQTNSSVDVTTPINVIWDNYSNANNPGTKYWWSVNVTDGTLWTNATYCFTTKT